MLQSIMVFRLLKIIIFSLFVNLNNDKDIEKARIFNSIVNTKNKKLTLTKVI